MKDLYTFDATESEAFATYERVRETYRAFFKEFKIPFITAEAASGEIGGDLSHEYHLTTRKGEDNVLTCDACNYAANEELAQSRFIISESGPDDRLEWTRTDIIHRLSHSDELGNETDHDSLQWIGISKDRKTLFQVFVPKEIEIRTVGGKQMRRSQINLHALKKRFPGVDLSVKDPLTTFKKHLQTWERAEFPEANNSMNPQILRVFDIRYSKVFHCTEPTSIDGVEVPVIAEPVAMENSIDLVKIETGDPCPKCVDGILKVESAVELGHTFHLGTRYSTPLNATVVMKDSSNEQVAMQMGCHGIGISRLIAAVADALADEKGLNWPRVIAPFEAAIVSSEDMEDAAVEVYDTLTNTQSIKHDEKIDVILDDRKKQLGWKLRDADMIGYPLVIVVGRYWTQGRRCEVQCRRLGLREVVAVGDLREFVREKLRLL